MYQRGFGNIVIYNKANIGCGYDIKPLEEGWLNIDNHVSTPYENLRIWDITTPPTDLEHDLTERFDFILVNHVLCTMNDYQVHKALINLHRCLKPGGTLQVIDMDLLKVFNAYQEDRISDIPIEEGDIDDRLCFAISGYGTRNSLYTANRMENVLYEAGFRFVLEKDKSEFDSRPKESLVFEAKK